MKQRRLEKDVPALIIATAIAKARRSPWYCFLLRITLGVVSTVVKICEPKLVDVPPIDHVHIDFNSFSAAEYELMLKESATLEHYISSWIAYFLQTLASY